jgi:hypothetical protein
MTGDVRSCWWCVNDCRVRVGDRLVDDKALKVYLEVLSIL